MTIINQMVWKGCIPKTKVAIKKLGSIMISWNIAKIYVVKYCSYHHPIQHLLIPLWNSCHLNPFLPALGGISPYMSITWQQLVGIRLNLIIISSLDLKWKAFKAKKALLTPFFGSSFQVKSFQQSVQQLLFDIVAKAKLL